MPEIRYRRLDKFTGVGDYTLYRMQFLHHAELMKWDEVTKGSQLSQLLSEKALEVLRFLQPHQMQDFQALDSQLQRRFGCVVDVNICKARLKMLKQTGVQTLEAYAVEVEDAVRGAFPLYPENLLQQQMVSAFIDGLMDVTMALLLVREGHTTLDAVLNSARVQPSQMLMDRNPRQMRVRATEAGFAGDGEEWAADSQTVHKMDAMVNAVNSMTTAVTSLSQQQESLLEAARIPERGQEHNRDRNRNRTDSREESSRKYDWRTQVICYHCNNKGHMVRECKILQSIRDLKTRERATKKALDKIRKRVETTSTQKKN